MTLATAAGRHTGSSQGGEDTHGTTGLHVSSTGEPEAESDDPAARWRVAYGALDVACTLVNAPGAALFACHAARLYLLALRGVDQRGLDRLEALWRSGKTRLVQGHPYGEDDPPLVVLPLADGTGVVVGLALFLWPEDRRPSAAAVLEPLTRVLAAILKRVVPGGSNDDVSNTDTVVEPNAVALLALLEQHDWNVSRVARLLGVTRMTVYNRMHRFGIPRKRPRLTARRRDAARFASIADTCRPPSAAGDRTRPAVRGVG